MNNLIVTTVADASIQSFPEADIHLYSDTLPSSQKEYDVIYFRDPFNTGDYDVVQIRNVIGQIIDTYPGAYFVDHIESFDDILIEDKWRQYTLFKEYMPNTQLLDDANQINENHLAKKRISARARDIVFRPEDIKYPPSEYILQEKLVLQEEYRVYVVRGEIQPFMSCKTSKTSGSKVKIQGIEALTDDVRSLTGRIAAKVPLIDFFGLDIARTNSGLVLIELNRSPQFKRYSELSGDSLVNKLMGEIERSETRR